MPWTVWIACGMVAGSAWWSEPVAISLAWCLTLGLARWRGSAPWSLVCASTLALAVTAWRVEVHMHTALVRRNELVAHARGLRACEGRYRVMTSPVRLGDGFAFTAQADDLRCEQEAMPWSGVVRLFAEVAPVRGEVWQGVARLAPPELFWGPTDPRPDYVRRGIERSGTWVLTDAATRAPLLDPRPWIDRARARVRDAIVRDVGSGASPLMRALVLGESDLAEDERLAFQESGLSHLLAVSGMHLVLVVATVARVFDALLRRWAWLAARTDVIRVSAWAALALAWLYADFAGGSGSAVRAAWMMSAQYLARAFAVRADAGRALAMSVTLMAVLDPLVAFDVSFVLSALATLGLVVLSRPIEAWLARWLPCESPSPVVRSGATFLSGALASTLAATVACLPTLLLLSPRLPWVGIPLNVVAVPIGELAALPLALTHAALALLPRAPVLDDVRVGAATATAGALTWVAWLAKLGAQGPVVGVPPPTSMQMLALATVAFAFAVRALRRWQAAALLLLVIVLEEARLRIPSGDLSVLHMDVGQGDATLLRLPKGGAVLVDGGGLVGSPIDTGTRVVLPWLRALRIDALDLVVLSHPHPDHVTGLVAVARSMPIRRVWDNGQGEAEADLSLHAAAGPYAAWRAALRAHEVEVEGPASFCGAHALGGAELRVLAPCPSLHEGWAANDNSIVMRVAFGAHAFLLMGDAEHEAESVLLNGHAAEALRADVLKLGHHGSRTSTSPALLATVRPRYAIVSAGVRNRFGHPHASTLATLHSAQHLGSLVVVRTDTAGSVQFVSDGRVLRLVP